MAPAPHDCTAALLDDAKGCDSPVRACEPLGFDRQAVSCTRTKECFDTAYECCPKGWIAYRGPTGNTSVGYTLWINCKQAQAGIEELDSDTPLSTPLRRKRCEDDQDGLCYP